MGTSCKGCGREIIWITMPSGKQMPVDPRELTVVTARGEVVRGYEPHWATCEAAQDFRRGK